MYNLQYFLPNSVVCTNMCETGSDLYACMFIFLFSNVPLQSNKQAEGSSNLLIIAVSTATGTVVLGKCSNQASKEAHF